MTGTVSIIGGGMIGGGRFSIGFATLAEILKLHLC